VKAEVTVLFTEGCNRKCSFCYQRAYEKQKDRVSKESLRNLLKFLDSNFEGFEIKVFGGEPLICREEIEFFLNELKSYDGRGTYSLVTNGDYLDDSYRKLFLDYSYYLNYIIISNYELTNKRLDLLKIMNDSFKNKLLVALVSSDVDKIYKMFKSCVVCLTSSNYELRLVHTKEDAFLSELISMYHDDSYLKFLKNVFTFS